VTAKTKVLLESAAVRVMCAAGQAVEANEVFKAVMDDLYRQAKLVGRDTPEGERIEAMAARVLQAHVAMGNLGRFLADEYWEQYAGAAVGAHEVAARMLAGISQRSAA